MKLHQYANDSQVYMSIIVGNITAAVQTFTTCIADMNAWMSASRLRLYPAKTQVMWLGSSQLFSQIDIRDIPVLSTHVQPTFTVGTRHGTVSLLLLSSPTSSLRCSLIVNRNCQNVSPGIQLLSPGLL